MFRVQNQRKFISLYDVTTLPRPKILLSHNMCQFKIKVLIKSVFQRVSYELSHRNPKKSDYKISQFMSFGFTIHNRGQMVNFEAGEINLGSNPCQNCFSAHGTQYNLSFQQAGRYKCCSAVRLGQGVLKFCAFSLACVPFPDNKKSAESFFPVLKTCICCKAPSSSKYALQKRSNAYMF